MSLHGNHTGMTSAQKGHSLILDCFMGKRLTTWYSAVTDAWDTLCKEALPASLLLLTVVYAGAAQFGWAVVALVCTGGVACAVELPLAHLDPPLPTHSWKIGGENNVGQGCIKPFKPWIWCVLTEAHGFWSPDSVGLARSGRASQQHEARSTGVPHHRAHPPVVTIYNSIIVYVWPPTVHYHASEEDAKGSSKGKGLLLSCMQVVLANVTIVVVLPLHRDL